jgi:hypothetical protein
MAKATKRLSKRVTTVRQAIKAYGGELSMAEAFQTTVDCVRRWKRWGVIPCTDHLGLFLGLRARGFEPMPKLFDVKDLRELAGV